MISNEFWENVFSNLGFEKTTILGRTAFKIPIYEAIYMSQVMGPPGPTDFDLWWRAPFRVAIPTKDGKVLRFPNPCPSVRVEDIFLNESTMDSQLNPLLSPSLNFIKKMVPEFFDSKEKYLLFGNDSSVLEEIKAEGLNPTDFILFREGYYERSGGLPRRYIDEGIMEYITSSFLRGKGFIVDKFSERLTMGPGGPDLFAVKIPELQNKLIDLKIISGGFYLNELELLDVLGERTARHRIEETKSVVIEVESPTDSGRFSAGRRQVLKYLGYGCYNEGYVALPFEEERAKTIGGKPEELGFIPFEDVGIITLSEDGKIILRNCSKSYGQERKIEELLKNLERIIKLTLLKNLPLKEVFDLLSEVYSFYDLYFAVDRLDTNEIVEFIKR